ncbi:hypothetical protein HDU96_001469 [Phlyctochytrium bullatum]|nr:hypothetical protein HDU96_001469 [Phlyctochytrium bullatum]
MLTPSVIERLRLFHPSGTTPATNLAQFSTLEDDLSLLLLGCGDVRNILFTVYSDTGSEFGMRRTLDFTCCDDMPEIVARNTLLLTMIMDGVVDHEIMWNVYYDLKLDDVSLKTLYKQAKKLLVVAKSTEMLNAKKEHAWLDTLHELALSEADEVEWARDLDDEGLMYTFKASLDYLFTRFAGIPWEPQHSVFFFFSEANEGGVYDVLIISAMRLDSGNQTLVLDAAVLSASFDALEQLDLDMGPITVTLEEHNLWHNLLPSFAERCRHYPHLLTCEYRSGQKYLCSCGKGKFPSTFRKPDVPSWKKIRKFATRVAIPICFSLPFPEVLADKVIAWEAPAPYPRRIGKFLRKAIEFDFDIGVYNGYSEEYWLARELRSEDLDNLDGGGSPYGFMLAAKFDAAASVELTERMLTASKILKSAKPSDRAALRAVFERAVMYAACSTGSVAVAEYILSVSAADLIHHPYLEVTPLEQLVTDGHVDVMRVTGFKV